MSRVKNLTLPFPARETRKNYHIGTIPLRMLENLEKASKSDSVLSFYNYISKKTIEDGRPVYKVLKERSPQTVFVLDFDKCTVENSNILECFEEFNEKIGGKAQFLKSFSGTHIMYVVNDVISEEGYRVIQEMVSSMFFGSCLEKLDKHSSLKLGKGFYHSQHWNGWLNAEMLNITESSQKENGGFFKADVALSRQDLLMPIVDKCADLVSCEGLSNESVVFMYGYLMGQMAVFLKKFDEIMLGVRKETEKYDEKTYGRFSAALRGVLAYIESGKSKELCARALQRAPKERYSAVYSFIKSCFGYECGWSKAVPEVSSDVGRCSDSGRAAAVTGNVEQSREDIEFGSNEGNPEEGTGSGDACDNGHETFDRKGFLRDCSTERVLEFVQTIDVLCKRGKIDINVMGDIISENSLRGHSYWHFESKESNFSVFFGIVRQVLDSSEWLPLPIRSSPIGCLEWLRHVESYLRNSPDSEGRLRKIAQAAASGFRLYCKVNGYSISEHLPRFQLSADGRNATEFINDLESFFKSDKCPSMSKDNKQTVARYFREEKSVLEQGSKLLMDFLEKQSFNILNGEGVNIGAKDFEILFDVNARAATALRLVFMAFISVGLDKEYVPVIRKRSYLINKDLVSRYVELKMPAKVIKPEDLRYVLGNGNTWNAISTYTKGLVARFGLEKTINIWHNALDQSDANDKERRKKEAEKFASLVYKQLETDGCHRLNRQTA